LQYDGTHVLGVTPAGEVLIVDPRNRRLQRLPLPLSPTLVPHELAPDEGQAGSAAGPDALERRGQLARTLLLRLLGPARAQGPETAAQLFFRKHANSALAEQLGKRSLVKLLYRAQQKHLIWLTSDHEIAVFDVASKRVVARLLATAQHGVDGARFAPDGSLLLLSAGVLRAWDVSDQRLRFARTGPYYSLTLLGTEHVLATRPGGYGDLVRLSDGTVQRSVCLTADSCIELAEDRLQTFLKEVGALEESPPMELVDYVFGRQVRAEVSPDGKYLLAIKGKGAVRRPGGKADEEEKYQRVPRQLSIWDTTSWRRLSTALVLRAFADSANYDEIESLSGQEEASCLLDPLRCVRFTPDGVLQYFTQRYTVPELRLIRRRCATMY